MTEPGRSWYEQLKARRDALTAEHGTPVHVAESDALAQAAAARIRVDPAATANDVYASIYRDAAAAGAWVESDRVFHGHPVLAMVPLPDGRVIGILDLRPALERARGQS